MGVYIKGMKIPKDEPLRIVLNPSGQLIVDNGTWFKVYETVEIPQHGDLIGRDKLKKRFCVHCDDYKKCQEPCFDLKLIDSVDVIIPAEEGER